MFRKSPMKLDSVDAGVKTGLIERLKECVKEIQLKYTAENWIPLKNEEVTNTLCWILEAIFIHGLKNTFIKSLSVFSSSWKENAIPNPSFWDFVMIFSHRDIIEQIRKLNYVNSDVGRSRAWIRITLNEMSLVSYLENIFRNAGYVRNFYKPTAFLRDSERCDILKNYLIGIIDSCKFDLVVDNSLLNHWNSGPLALVGLWVDNDISQGVDVAQNMDSKDLQAIPQLGKSRTPEPQFISALRRQPLLPEEDAFRIIMASKPSNSSNAPSSSSSRKNSDSSMSWKDYPSTSGIITQNATSSSNYLIPPRQQDKPKDESKKSSPKPSPPAKVEEFKSLQSSSSLPKETSQVVNHTESNDLIKSDSSLPCVLQIPDNNTDPRDNDEVVKDSKELNAPETNSDAVDDGLSYAELFSNYNKEVKVSAAIYSGSPMETYLDTETATADDTGLDETTSSIIDLPVTNCAEDGFEFINWFSTNRQLSEMLPNMTKYAGKIANEVGMDMQQYSCKLCRAPIGMSFVPTRVCHFTGYYFCTSCHLEDENLIPSRILLNWDFTRYTVCRQASEFLEEIKDQPLFDLNEINPKLYIVIDELAEIQKLRTKLNYVSVYLKTCKDPIVLDEIKREIWPREYLFEKIHLFSLIDLSNVSNRILATTLTKIFNLGKSHILSCKICLAKGFICEICRNPEVIFPFNLESIFKCRSCGAVYHDKCMNNAKPCPRCQRWKVTLSDEDL